MSNLKKANEMMKNDPEVRRAAVIAICERRKQLGRNLTDEEMREAAFFCLAAFGEGVIYSVRFPKKAKKFYDLIWLKP